MPRAARSCAGSGVTSRERKSRRPAAARTDPEMALSRVVLPAPLGPTMVTNSPSLTSSETSSRAWRPAYATLRPEIRRMSVRVPGEPTLAQVRLDDGGVAGHVAGQALGEPAALLQHHEAIGDLHEGLDGVLDDDDRHAGFSPPPGNTTHSSHHVARG